jgi:hypothetical protein
MENSIKPPTDRLIDKDELKRLYETLIVSHLPNSSQDILSFDAWCAQLDS